MFKIVSKKELNDAVTMLEIEAPFIAKKAKAGQFIIFRVDEYSERVLLALYFKKWDYLQNYWGQNKREIPLLIL